MDLEVSSFGCLGLDCGASLLWAERVACGPQAGKQKLLCISYDSDGWDVCSVSCQDRSSGRKEPVLCHIESP